MLIDYWLNNQYNVIGDIMNEIKDIIKIIENKKMSVLNSRISKKLKKEYLTKYDDLLFKYYTKYINCKDINK